MDLNPDTLWPLTVMSVEIFTRKKGRVFGKCDRDAELHVSSQTHVLSGSVQDPMTREYRIKAMLCSLVWAENTKSKHGQHGTGLKTGALKIRRHRVLFGILIDQKDVGGHIKKWWLSLMHVWPGKKPLFLSANTIENVVVVVVKAFVTCYRL